MDINSQNGIYHHFAEISKNITNTKNYEKFDSYAGRKMNF